MHVLSISRVQSKYSLASKGKLIFTNGIVDGIGYELLLHQIETFKCIDVIVIGNNKLYNQLLAISRVNSNKKIDMLHIFEIHLAKTTETGNKRIRHKLNKIKVENYFLCSQVLTYV
jgi:polyribonucleotide 5'-hydroxyl-kinase